MRAVRETRGVRAGLLPLPMIRSTRWPGAMAVCSTLVSQASLTRRPFSPRSTERRAWRGAGRTHRLKLGGGRSLENFPCEPDAPEVRGDWREQTD